MQMSIQKQLSALLALKTKYYRAIGNPHPEFAAQCQVDLIFKQVQSQPKYIDRLMAEEVEDAATALTRVTTLHASA